jgi:hypothetical protein
MTANERAEILFDKLKSDLGIQEALLKAQRNFSMNTSMQVAYKVTEYVISEIETQLKELRDSL